MAASATIAASAAVATASISSWSTNTTVIVVGAVLLAVIALLFAIPLLLSRRRYHQDMREVVRTLEGLRSGEARSQVDLAQHSPLALVSDAVNRLGTELGARWRDAERAKERARAVLEAAQETAVVLTDTDGDVLTFSQGAVELFGWQEEEMVSRSAALLFEEESYKAFLPKLARRTLRVRGVAARATLLRRDGSTFPADIQVRMVQDAAGKGTGFSMLVSDVSQQVRLEQELRGSENRYRSLVEGLTEGVLIARGGRVLYCNPALAELCGLTPEELQDTALRDRIATRDVLLVEERLGALEQRGSGAEELRTFLIDPTGEPGADVLIQATPIEYGGAPAVLLHVRDETVDRRVELELQRNETQLDAVLEAASDGILVLGDSEAGERVQMCNRTFAQLLGVRLDELLGADLGTLLGRLRRRGDGAEAIAELLVAPRSGPRRESIALGKPAPRKLTLALGPLTDRFGHSVGRVLVCRDVTEQRESEYRLQSYAEELQLRKAELEHSYAELEQMHAEAGRRGAELDRLNEELRRLDEMKSNLLGNVTHELQTPLVSVRGYTEMILKGRLGAVTEEQRKGLTLSLKNIDRLISMIDNLLSFARGQPELGTLELSRFPMRPLVLEAVDLLQQNLNARGIRLTEEIDPALSVHADREKILQVLLNLLSNAIKFNKEGGSILISARPGRGDQLLMAVQDTGIGIPREEAVRIFDRRYRVENQEAEGSGIGLAIAQDILRLHGSRIHVDSTHGEGSTFSFTLPLSVERAAEGSEEGPTPREIRLETPPSSPEPPAERAERPEAEPAIEPEKPPRFRIIRRSGSGH